MIREHANVELTKKKHLAHNDSFKVYGSVKSISGRGFRPGAQKCQACQAKVALDGTLILEAVITGLDNRKNIKDTPSLLKPLWFLGSLCVTHSFGSQFQILNKEGSMG